MGHEMMSGFIFERGDGHYIAVIERASGVYWGIDAVRSAKGHSYSDLGEIKFPDGLPYAFFSLPGYRTQDLLGASQDIKTALERTRDLATRRMQEMISLEDRVQKRRVAEQFGDVESDLSQAVTVFAHECDTIFGEHLLGDQ